MSSLSRASTKALLPFVSKQSQRVLWIRSLSTINTSQEILDVVIVGGGVIGCALASQITQRLPRLRIALVEAGSEPNFVTAGSNLPHPRSYALSPASLRLLGLDSTSASSSVSSSNTDASVSRKNDEQRLGFYHSMQIWEAKQPASLIFDATHDLLPDSPSTQPLYLGAVVEDAVLQRLLWKQLQQTSCRLLTRTKVTKIELPSSLQSDLVKLQLQNTSDVDENASAGTTMLRSRLLVAADGANSQIRQQSNIPFHTISDYENEMALTFTVQLSSPHNNRAFQRFTKQGVIALLPTFSPLHAIVVWSTKKEHMQFWKDHNDLPHHINDLLQQGPQQIDSLFGDNPSPSILSNVGYGMDKVLETVHYGMAMAAQEGLVAAAMTGLGSNQNTAEQKITSSPSFLAPPLINVSVHSPRFAFPLSCRYAETFTKPRLALCGDAAHTMHPLAGQGLNLGLQDVQNLLTSIERAVNAGMDPACFLSSDYEESRHFQVKLTLAGIHTIHQLFTEPFNSRNNVSTASTAAKHVKSLGMSLIQTVGPLRRRLVQAACHGVSMP